MLTGRVELLDSLHPELDQHVEGGGELTDGLGQAMQARPLHDSGPALGIKSKL